MTKLSDAVAELESNIEALTAERDMLRRQVERQKGAIEEGRGVIRSLQKENAEARELIGTFQTHFHTFHGSAKHVAEQEQALANAAAPQAQVIDQTPTLMDRLANVMRPTNGAAH